MVANFGRPPFSPARAFIIKLSQSPGQISGVVGCGTPRVHGRSAGMACMQLDARIIGTFTYTGGPHKKPSMAMNLPATRHANGCLPSDLPFRTTTPNDREPGGSNVVLARVGTGQRVGQVTGTSWHRPEKLRCDCSSGSACSWHLARREGPHSSVVSGAEHGIAGPRAIQEPAVMLVDLDPRNDIPLARFTTHHRCWKGPIYGWMDGWMDELDGCVS